MDPTLERLCARVVAAHDENGVAAAVLDETSDLADVAGYFALSEPGAPPVAGPWLPLHIKGAPAGFAEHYERDGRAGDPLLASVAASHCPASLDLNRFRCTTHPPASEAARRFRDHVEHYPELQHYLLSPIVVDGELARTLHFARLEDRPFDSTDLGFATAASMHVSSRLSALVQRRAVPATWRGILTPRNLEVAEVVALGMTNAEAGEVLGVSSNAVKKHLGQMFTKLGVASRAELVRALLFGPAEWMSGLDPAKAPGARGRDV